MSGKTLLNSNLTFEEAEELIKNGADVNEQDHDGATPLFYTFNMDIAELLIKSGADVNHKDIEGCTIFHYINCSCKNASFYIQHGANINERNNYGNTPLDGYYERHRIKELINNDALFSKIKLYNQYKHFYPKEKQDVFDSFLLLTDNDQTFFQMCLAYQKTINQPFKMTDQLVIE